MEYRDEDFDGKVIDLDGNTFSGCTFRNCSFVFRAKASCLLVACKFKEDSQWAVDGPARGTLQFLSMLYHLGEAGRQVIEKFFDDIRSGRYE